MFRDIIEGLQYCVEHFFDGLSESERAQFVELCQAVVKKATTGKVSCPACGSMDIRVCDYDMGRGKTKWVARCFECGTDSNVRMTRELALAYFKEVDDDSRK